MLNIPNEIKALFKTDGTRKNFRVHFPNGELADITNANVVKESLRFTESLCSQNVFRFGLAEASVLEFETVGIGNMYGYTIEAGIEIDTSSLSAATIATIVGSPGDGVIVEENDSDLGYGFYRVPLGVFRVESCPRNHGAMTRRKVTAYTDGVSQEDIMSPFEQWKQSVWWAQNRQFYYSYESWLDANFAWFDPTILNTGYTKTEITSRTTAVGADSINKNIDIGGNTLNVQASVTLANIVHAGFYMNPDFGSQANIYTLVYDDFDNSSALAWVEASLESLGLSAYCSDVLDCLGRFIYPYWQAPSRGSGWPSGSPDFLFTQGTSVVRIDDYHNAPARFYAYKSVSFSLAFNGTTLSQTITMSAGSPYRIWRYKKDDLSNDHQVAFQPSGTKQVSNGYIDVTYYSFIDSYSFLDMYRSWLELHGKFAKEERSGKSREIALSPTSPTSVAAGDYAEMWWNEYDVSPIGTVTITYTDAEGGEGTADAVIGDGASRYDMSDNTFIKASVSMSFDDITTLLAGDFAINAKNVGFTPVELSMQGWPWMEAGDALEITAEDGTVVDTYALRIEMSGIQHLTMDITSQGGEIIGEA